MNQTRPTAAAFYSTLAIALPLAGCAAGGGGGGDGAASPGGGSPGVAIVTAAPPVLASSTTGGAAPSVFGALMFPLYGFIAYGGATVPTARVGTRTEAADGSITLTYVDSVGPKLVTFRPGDITDRDADGFAAQRGNLTYVETWADSAAGFALQHMRVGLFTFPDLGGTAPAMFAFGHQTPIANVPSVGSATYTGQTSGVRWATAGGVVTGDVFGGDVRFDANFGSRTISGTIDHLVIDPDGAKTSLPYTFSANGTILNYGSITTTVATAGVQGSVSATSPGLSGNGNLMGQLFGPNANEVGGTWFFYSTAGDLQLLGVFGARSEVGLQPDGAMAPRRFATAGSELPGAVDIDWRVTSPFAPTSFNLPLDFLRRLGSDGSVVVAYTEAGSVFRRTLASGDFSVSTDASRRARLSSFDYLESGLRSTDVPFGDTGEPLAYARYGRYWTGATSSSPFVGANTQPVTLPFHFGALTQSAAVAADFRAEFTGLTRAVANEGTIDPVTGRFDLTTRTDLEGVVTLAADLGRGTLSGKLFGFSSRNAAGSTSFADLAMISNGPGTVTVVDGALRLSGVLRAVGEPNFEAQLDGSVYGPAGEEVAGTWYGTYARTGTNMTYLVGGFGAGRAETATSDRRTWNHVVGAYTLNQSAHQVDLNVAGAVVASTDLPGITGTLAPRTDGGYTLALVDGGGTRTISFLGSALKADTLAPRVEIVSGTRYGLTLMEGQGSDVELTAGRTADLAYMRFGHWAESTHSDQTVAFGLFHAGNETPLAQIPTSGTATYHGSTVGIAFQDDVTTRIFSPLTLNADFAGRTITGSATQFSAVNLGGAFKGLAASAPFQQLNLNGAISGNGFAGTSSSSVIGVTGTGTFDGKFYGPNAVEAGGTWRVDGPGGTMKAWGSFGATR